MLTVLHYDLDPVPELVVLHYTFLARLRVDLARLAGASVVPMTTRDIQLLSGMRESSVRNALAGSGGETLPSFLSRGGQRLIDSLVAHDWLSRRRGYRATDLSDPVLCETLKAIHAEREAANSLDTDYNPVEWDDETEVAQ